jgi:hypothetical protein
VNDEPALTTGEVKRLLADERSVSVRLRYAAVLVAALTMVVVTTSVWLTEPALPMRTHLAFGAVVAIGAAWVVVCTHVLARRRVLFAVHRIAVARLVIVCSILLAAGAAIAWWSGLSPIVVATAMGVACAMGGWAAVFLWRGRRRLDALQRRRRAIERARG